MPSEPCPQCGCELRLEYTEDVQCITTAAFEADAVGLFLGAVVPYATSAAPAGTLPCDGSTFQRADYPDLYAVLDPMFYIDADSARTPDLRSKVVVGSGQGQSLSNRVFGAQGGLEAVTLITGQMPAHKHRRNTMVRQTGPGSFVSVQEYVVGDVEATNQGNLGRFAYQPNATGAWGYLVNETESTGNSQPHENMPPFLALRYCMVAVAPTVPVSTPNDLYVAQQEYWLCECCNYAEIRGGCDDGTATDDQA